MDPAAHNESSASKLPSSTVQSSNPANHDRLSDVELLRMFVQDNDQSAMTTIIQRHGRLVMGVCRRILNSEHDAADAFQATFLVLLKKANSLGNLTSLAGWLYGVADRVANKSRTQSHKRQKREGSGVAMIPTTAPTTQADEEAVGLIHAELGKLPEKYRLPLILCCLEGEEREVAAQQLGWTIGSLKGRLERGREMLLARLKRRGVILSATMLTALMAQQAVADVPVALASSTVSALTMVAAGQSLAGGAISIQTATLTQGVLKAMLITKLKISGVILLTGAMATTGSVVAVRHLVAASGVKAAATSNAGAQAKNDTSQPKNQETQEKNQEKKPDPQQEAKQENAQAETQLSDEEQLKLRRESMNHMKQLGLAMYTYEAAHGRFPAAAIYGKDGKPLLSWRVLLLPYLDEEKLYKQFKLDEPWDSPTNKPLLAKMPEIFLGPGKGDKYKTDTFYQVFTGKGTPFDGQTGLSQDEIKDGPSSTVFFVEAAKPVPWTKPADLVYDAKKPLPKLGGLFKDGFCAGIADGSARFVPRDVSDIAFRPWITPAAGDTAGQF